jgi:hypothetical protein
MPNWKENDGDSEITHLTIEYGNGGRHFFNELLNT